MSEDDQKHWLSRLKVFYRKKTLGKKMNFTVFVVVTQQYHTE